MEVEKEFKDLCDDFKIRLNRDMEVIKIPEEAGSWLHKLAVDNLAKFAQQVSDIERASILMCKKASDCDTLINKQGYYGAKSIFLKMTEHLKLNLLALQKI